MDTRTLLRERLRRSRDWTQTIDELEKELEASGSKPEQSERLFELATLVEDLIPERDKALTLYQRAWKLHPDNLKALSRAREVYGEIGRYEMVAKLGEMELRSPLAAQNLAQIVGEAMLDSGQKDKALPILQRALGAEPNSIRVKDALAAVTYDNEGWSDTVDMLADDAESHDDATCVRMLLRAARIVKIEAPEDPRLEELLKRIFVKDIDEPSANFMFETLLAAAQRWDDLERHQMHRVDRAPDHTRKVDALRMFALEWLQRWKDKDRGAKYFDAALKATASNGASSMKSVVAAFSLVRQVAGDKGEWNQLLDLADAVLERVSADDRLFVAIQCGHIAFDKTNDLERAKKYFAIAASIEPQNPNVQDFISVAGDLPMAAGSMPTIPVQTEPAGEPVVEAAPEPVVEAKPTKGKRSKRNSAANIAAPVEEAKPVDTKPMAVDASMPTPVVEEPKAAPTPAPVIESPHVETKPMAVEAKAPAADIPADLDSAMQKAKAAEGGPDKGVAAWKSVIAANVNNPLPRRELARVLRGAASWAQLVDALKDEEAKAA
jgi:tetratricopeptide (TPR) repeat protein